MSKSTHQFEIKGVDKSGGAFASIKQRAATTSAQIRSIVGSALALSGTYLGFRSIKGGVDELSHLSDIAQKTNTNVGELTQTAAAFSALGIQNMGVDQLSKAFDYMVKTTGRSGMEGFYKTIDELGKIPDVSERAQSAMRVFGRSGMEFMPLLNAADLSVNALRDVVAAMPKVPQSAAKAGAAMSNAMGFAANQVKSIWLQGLASICGWFDNEYTGGVREASLKAGNYMEYYAKLAVTKCLTWYRKVQEYLKRYGEYWGTFIGTKMGGGSWTEAFQNAENAWQEALKEYDDVSKGLEQKEHERSERFLRDFEDRMIVIKKFQDAYENAAISIGKRDYRDVVQTPEISRQTRISNDLIFGGSNAATRLQLLGPTLQNETKKQTDVLNQINEKIGKLVDNTDNMEMGEFVTIG